MKLKNHILILTYIALSTFPIFGQNAGPKVGPKVGDVIIKNVNVDGKPTPKLVGVYSFCEYTKDGKELNGQELRLGTFLNEYDSKGNMTHLKNSTGSEEWYEYDKKGNEVHAKWTFDDFEYWKEYDSKGNETHIKYASGTEIWYEYTFHPNGKVKTKTSYMAIQ